MTYWGEIPSVADIDSGIAAIEREQITRPKALEVDGPPLHQPSNRHHPPTNESIPSDHTQIDPLVIHSIRLVQHIKKLKTAIAEIQSDSKKEPNSSAFNVGPIPAYDGPDIKVREKNCVLSEGDYDRPFIRGEGEPPPAIDDVTCRRLLRRSTAAICAHLSFDTTSESVLETLTDVCHEFFCQITTHLATAADRQAEHGSSGFPDIIERVFHDLGLGSVTDLHTFYQQRVINYHKRLMAQCNTLMAQHATYLKMSPSKGHGHDTPSDGDTFNVIRIKDESSGEMMFPLLDENDEVNEAEQLLNIESLGAFEITVEHETGAGLTTEVESRWPSKSQEATSRLKSSASIEEMQDGAEGASSIPVTPQSAVPHTPNTPHSDTNIQEPGSISSMDIFSPTLTAPSKAKKKKKN